MKFRLDLLIISILTFLFTVGTIVVKFLFELDWRHAFVLIFDLVFGSGIYHTTGRTSFQLTTLYIIAFTGAAIQLGIIIYFVSLIMRLILRKQVQIQDRIEYIIANYPVRRLFAILFFSILFFSVIIIKTVEQISWLDAFYFMIITISTVGFGDVTPHHPVTKIVTIILVFNGITFIGLASQVIINRIVNLQLTRQNLLPVRPLSISNHIIIAGYGSKGRRLSQLFLERGYEVVVVERDEERARLAEINGYQVLVGDITKPALLEILSLNEASGLFLLLSDDNIVIQAGIIARSIAEDLDIYGEFLSAPTYNIARYAGINKPISLSVFLTNELQGYFNTREVNLIQTLRDLRTQESSLGFIQVPLEFDYSDIFENPLVIGDVSPGLNEIYLDSNITLEYEPPSSASHKLIAVDRDELDQKLKSENNRLFRQVDRLIFAGYSELIDTLISRLDFPEENIIVLWQNPEYQDELQQKSYKKYQWTLENGHSILEQIVRNGDMIICTFEDITSSLIVGVTLNNLRRDTSRKNLIDNVHLIQFVPYEYDIEPLMKVGAHVVYTPQQIISSAILGIFLKENNLSPSLIYTNGHLYEHLVMEDGIFCNKRISDLSNDRYNILYVRSKEMEYFSTKMSNYILNPGDRVLLFIKNENKERIDPVRR